MIRSTLARAALACALLTIPAIAAADPVISTIGPNPVTANTGASITITGSGFGAADDRIWFPGTNNWVNPTGWGAGSVTCTVPATWSGAVQVQSHGAGNLSNALNLTIIYSYSGNKWPGLPVHWRLNPAGAPGCTFGDTQAALSSGFDVWSCASGYSHAYDGTSTNTPGLNDGVNVMAWLNSGWSPGTIAVTNWWYVGANKVDADIAFNSQHYTWSCSGAGGAMDVQNIGTHEQGHFIGLLDLYGADDVAKTMYGFGSNGEVQKRALDPADVQGAEFMYGHAGRANFAAGTPGGWYGPLVPRVTSDATGAFAPLPATLPGNATCYLNAAMTNNGSDCGAPWGTDNLYVDDVGAWGLTWAGVWGAGATYGLWTNLGTYVGGGRHTLRIDDDVLNEVTESNEFDNRFDAQFVWSPYGLADQTPVTRVEPPVEGPFGARNCDGFQMTGNWWACAGIIPTSSNDDYDLNLYNDYANSTTGFSASVAGSGYLHGESDFVLVNGNNAGVGYGATRWVGVQRYTPGTSAHQSFVIHQSNQVGFTLFPSTTYGSSVNTGTVTMGASDVVKVHEIYFGSTTTSYQVHLVNLSGSADLNISLYAASGAYFGKGGSVATAQVVGSGTDEIFTYTPPATGYYGLVVWKRGSSDLGLSNDYRIEVGPTLTDLQATVVPGGFDGVSVPRNDATAGLNNAHVSPVLDGNTNDTYVNWAIQEVSPNAFTPGWSTYLFLDVDDLVAAGGTGDNTYTNISFQAVNIGTLNIRGGRHTLTAWADPGNAVPEVDETNNVSPGDQYVWSPLLTTKASPMVRAVPPNTGSLTYPNGDGYRFDRTPGYAWVVGEAPLAASGDDYDLVVYSDYVGSTSGFTTWLGGSAAGGAYTDFVVGHFSGTPNTVYPEILRYLAGTADVVAIDQTDSQGRDQAVPHSYLNQVMAAHRLVDVYEAYLISGNTYYIQLGRGSGTSDMAFAVFTGASGTVNGRFGAQGYSSPLGPDGDQLTFTATVTGYHPIVVYRDNSLGAATPVIYSLVIGTSPLAVDDALPRELEFAGAAPNPCVGRTRLGWALPAAAHVRLAIYDVNGRRLRSLVDSDQPAGRQSVAWDGRGDGGTPLEAGLYWARFESGGRTMVRRIALLR